MAGNELATAYLTLVPSLKGAQASITQQLGGVDTTAAGRQMGDRASSGFGGGFNIKGAALAAAATAAAAAAVKFVDIMTDSLWAYADRQQLVGGVETLFKDSSDQLQEYAANAYKTAGVSANEYMEMSTSFAASLIQSLEGDTEAAVKYANIAITDMSDNANKMGSDITMIQNAYQGFAKQNYTMLDNLKLGYGGTKEEMERLLADAEAIQARNGVLVDYTIEDYADVVDAIHVVQTEMGITGTTAAEASDTISGSIASMKAKWNDWLVALAEGNEDITAETEELVGTITTAVWNIVPVIGQVLATILYLIAQKMIDMMQAGLDLIKNLAQGVVDGFPFVLSEIGRGIQEGIDKIKSFWAGFFGAGGDLMDGLRQGITAKAAGMANAAANAANAALTAAKNALGIASPSKKFMEVGKYSMEGMALGIKNKASDVIGAVSDAANGAVGAASFSATPQLATAGVGAGAGSTTINLYCDIKDLQGIQTLNDLYDVLARARAINPTRR